MKYRMSLVLVAAVVAAGQAQVWPQPDEWPMPAADGKAANYSRVAALGVTNQLWRANLSSIRTEMATWRQAIAAHGRIYAKSRDTIAAFDAGDGATLWSKPQAATEIAATGGGTLLALAAGKVVAYDGRTGDWRWEAAFPEPEFVPRLVTGNDFVLVATGFFDDPAEAATHVRVFDSATGLPVGWNEGGRRRLTNQLMLWEHPAVLSVGKGAVLVLTMEGPVVKRTPNARMDESGPRVACVGDRCVQGFVQPGRALTTVTTDYQTVCLRASATGDLTPTWKHEGGADGWGAAVEMSLQSSAFGLGYFQDSGTLISFNPATGEEHWRQEKGWPMVAMAAAGQTAYCAFQIPGPGGTGTLGTELQALSTSDGAVSLRMRIPAVTANTILAAYRRLYVLGHYDPAVRDPERTHENIPVLICFGSK